MTNINETDVTTTTVVTDERTINKIGGRGESTSTQSVSSASITTVELDAVDKEDDSGVLDVDTTNNRIRVKKSGWIAMFGSVSFASNLGDGTRYIFNLVVNGTAIAQDAGAIGADLTAGGTPNDVKDLSVDDDITVEAYQDSGGSKLLRGDERCSLGAIHEG